MQMLKILIASLYISCLHAATPADGFAPVCLSHANIEQLVRLCVVECRGMEDARDSCCASSVSTALARMYYYQENSGYYLAGDTLDDVLGYSRDNIWQFPPYAYRGCDWDAGGVHPSSVACLENEDHGWAAGPALDCVLNGECGGCPYYLYYSPRAAIDALPGACEVESIGGIHWYHDGWGAHPVPSWHAPAGE